MYISGRRRNLVVLKSRHFKAKKESAPVIEQLKLEMFLGMRRELAEMEENIAIALSKGARNEPGIHKAELIPERRPGSGAGAGFRMKLIIIAIFVVLLPAASAAVAQEQVMKQDKMQKRSEKQKRKEVERQRKEDRQKEEWEISTRPPEPAYPGSIRQEFSTAARQTALLIDNAFNTIQKSRIEFMAANQTSIQAASLLFGGAQSEGERQVGRLLYTYAQKVPVCQELAWDSVQSVLALAVYSKSYRQCQTEAARLRGTADRTLARNSQP